MNEHQIALPKQTYQTLLAVAQQQGVTPADWIASQLSLAVPKEQPLTELIADLIGSIDSQAEPRSQANNTRSIAGSY